MSKTIDRLPLARAQVIAEDLVRLLQPACIRIAVAGSIRRGAHDIGDVEVVCIPKVDRVMTNTHDLFGEPAAAGEINRLDELCQRALAREVFRYRLNKDGKRAWGSDLKWGVYQDFPIDIYSATAETFAVTLTIRTGPAKFSERLVTRRSQGGFCPDYLQFKGWRLRRRDTGEPIDTPEEPDLFSALGLEYVMPEFRTDNTWPRRLEFA